MLCNNWFTRVTVTEQAGNGCNEFHLVQRGIFLYAKIHSGDSYLMPTLNWIGKDAVINHHKQVPFRLLKCNDKLSVGDNSGNPLSTSCNCGRQQGG